jgi:hypothetical protein
MKRRHFAAMSLATAGGATLARMYTPPHLFAQNQRPPRSRVAVLSAESYSDKLDGLLYDALRLFALDVKGKTVLLKPNLIEYIAGVEVNTNPWLVGAASEAFRRLGARRVVVGEGPGHQRDTQLVLAESGLESTSIAMTSWRSKQGAVTR